MTWFFPQSGGVVTLANGDDVFVAQQVFINDQIHGPGTGHQVIVAGTVALYGAPVILVGNITGANSVTIESTGQIRGFTASGVGMQGVSQTLVNHGLIRSMDGDYTGYEAVFFYSGASTSTTASRFTNTGIVEADSNGVNHYRSPETLYVDNSGMIKGGVASFISDGTSIDIVTNKGTMIGSIVLGDGNDVYDGRLGKVQGSVSGGGGNDMLYGGSESNVLNGGAGTDQMYGGLGNDAFYVDNAGDKVFEAAGQGTDIVYSSVSYALSAGQHVETLTTTLVTGTGAINLAGNELAQRINGNNGANILSGAGGNDVLAGYGGNDVLRGGAGNDTLVGGAGSDYFVFDAAPNSITNVDTLTDFNVVADTIRLDNAVMAGLGVTLGTLSAAKFWKNTTGLAHDADDRIIYETDTGKLFYDSNGIAAGGAVQIAKLAPNLALTNADFVVI